MERYKNISGNSGISAYKIKSDSIIIQFTDGAVYLYTYQSANPEMIEKMKELAVSGSGLNTYINKYVRKSYERKLS